MNRIITLLYISFLFISCNLQEENQTLPADLSEEKPVIASTAMQVKPVPLMLPFHLDSSIVNDSIHFLNARIYFPVSAHPHYHDFNLLSRQYAHAMTEEFRKIKNSTQEEVSVETWVSEMSVNRDLVCFCFTSQSFTQGAAHYNHSYSTLNFNSINGKQVFLNDIFTLETPEQQTAFCTLVNPAEKGLGANLLETDDLKTVADFIIQNGKLIFYFDDYEKGPSMEKRSFELNAFRDFVRPEYRFLLTD